MSGGSMDYIYCKVQDAADMAEDAIIEQLLNDLAKVLKEQEWWYSCDITEEDYRKSLYDFKQKWFGNKDAYNKIVKEEIEKRLNETRKELLSLIGENPYKEKEGE